MVIDTEFKKRQGLEKSISFRNYIAIGLGAIVGIGWVMYAGQWLQDGGPVGAMLAFIICGLLLIPIGKCYAEMTSSIPVAGGEVAFSFKAFGPLLSFLTAWALALSYIFITPFETIAIGALTESIFPSLATGPLYLVGGYKVAWSTIVPGLMVGTYLIWLNYQGAKSSVRFQMWVVYALAVCTLVFTITALIKGSITNLSPMFAGEGSLWLIAPSSIISVLVVAPYFMAGFDTIPQAAEESGVSLKPHKLGVAILASIILGTIFYVLIILAVGMSASPEQLQVILQQKDVMPTAEVFRVAFGYEWAAQLVLFAALLGLISTLNGFYIASSRLLFSLGRGGMLPHWFAKVHDIHQTPGNAILFVGMISLAGPLIGLSALVPIVNSGSMMFTIALLMTCLSAVRLRYTAPELERPYRASIVTLYTGAIVSGILVLMMIVPGSPGQLQPLEFFIIGSWMVLGVVGFLIRMAKRDMDHEQRSYMILGEK